jgi:hypothetical protein
VLEHARTGDRPLLRDVPDQDDRAVEALRHRHHDVRRFAHLADRPGRAAHPLRVKCLDGVDHTGGRALGLERRHDRLEGRLRDDRHRERRFAEALGTQPDLGRGLFAGHVEDVVAARRQIAERHAGERRLADPGRASEEDERARDEPAAQHPVELVDACQQSRELRRGDVAQRQRLRRPPRRRTSPPAAGRATAGRLAPLLDERVPLAAAVAAPAPGK